MKREDIEKVAKDYSIGKTYFRRNVLKEVDADDYVLRKGNCSEDFIAGAEWRINSVWHSNNRTYKAQKPALVIFKNGKAKVYDNLTDLTIESLWGEIDDFLKGEKIGKARESKSDIDALCAMRGIETGKNVEICKGIHAEFVSENLRLQ